MAIPATKKELTEAITTKYQKLRAELADIPEGFTKELDLEGHAKNSNMSVCNLVSYLIGWGQLVLKWNQKKDNHLPVDFPETGFKWNELGKLAQKFYADYEKESYPKLLKKLDDTVAEILALIETKTNQQLYKANFYLQWPLGRLIQLNTSSPYQNATGRLRKWKKQKGIKTTLIKKN